MRCHDLRSSRRTYEVESSCSKCIAPRSRNPTDKLFDIHVLTKRPAKNHATVAGPGSSNRELDLELNELDFDLELAIVDWDKCGPLQSIIMMARPFVMRAQVPVSAAIIMIIIGLEYQ
jgi:hypothetical protein